VKPALVALAVVLATSVVHAQPIRVPSGELEPGRVELAPPSIDLVTFGVGDRIFEKFGHAALCIRYNDPQRGPVCFNYGVTDFDEGPAMIWSFLRSKQKFWVEPTELGSLVGFYRREDRDIWIQTLPLTGDQAREIEDKLWSDIEEEHRFYVYDHFLDNCTTRLRDMIDHATGGKLRAGSDAAFPMTFRSLVYRGLAGLSPLIGLADFITGRQLDRRPTLWQAMFHPDIFRQMVAINLGVEPRLLYKRKGPDFAHDGPTGRVPLLGLSLVFALPLLLAQWRRRGEKLALIWSTLYLALWGVLVWTLVCVSSIEAVRWNEVVFVVMPLDLALPVLGEVRRRRYARIRVVGLLLASVLCAVGVLRQPLWIPILTAIMPLAIIAFDLPNGLRARVVRPASDRAPEVAPDQLAS
jgi:hypothetical protein